MKTFNRRQALALSATAVTGLLLASPALGANRPKIIIIGGGFGGISAATVLKTIQPDFDITIVTETDSFSTCPFSNLVIAGLRSLKSITFSYKNIAAQGISIKVGKVTAIDAVKRVLSLADGSNLSFDRCIASPGIEMQFDQIPGYTEALQNLMPHAWKAGAQTLQLRDQLSSMRQGGTFIIYAPNTPYRCPVAPYERASLVAHYFTRHNPTAKILIVDEKDSFAKQALFTQAWELLYPGMITHFPFSETGGIIEVDAKNLEIMTSFENFKGDVVNFIPPQKAPQFLLQSGLSGNGLWCQIDEATFESKHAPNIHILGDAALVGDMPKSGFSASVQGGICAHAVASLMNGEPPKTAVLLNTCYSLVAPDYGISVAGAYRINDEGRLRSIKNTGGASSIDASDEVRKAEASYAYDWYNSLTHIMFG